MDLGNESKAKAARRVMKPAPQGGSGDFLVVKGLSKHFGALRAVDEVSFEVRQGQIFAIIGPNGAGKTTAFNCLTGVYPVTSGEVVFLGRRITGLPEYRITRLGVARTFQKIRIFKDISVVDNVIVGMHCRTRSGVWDALVHTPRAKQEERACRRRAMELLHFVGLDEYWSTLARHLSYGDQRRLEVARALGTDPNFLLLDEPVAGMNPAEKDEMMSLIHTIRDSGITVLLVEHDMKVVMGISDRILVLNHGEKIAEGTPREVQRNETVIEAYLGRGHRREPTTD